MDEARLVIRVSRSSEWNRGGNWSGGGGDEGSRNLSPCDRLSIFLHWLLIRKKTRFSTRGSHARQNDKPRRLHEFCVIPAHAPREESPILHSLLMKNDTLCQGL